MTESSGLILQTVDVGFFTAPPRAQPTSVYVISYRDGRTRSFTGTPSPRDRRGSHHCYIVDTTEHRARASDSVPTARDEYTFTVDVEATWKVTDPEAVVRKGTANGDDAVLARLWDEVWVISRQFAADRPGPAEMAARSALAAVRDLDEGITVLRATARFRMDSRLQGGAIKLDEDRLEGTLAGNQMIRLREWFDGSEHAAIIGHLRQHPDDTGSVLQLMREDRKQNQQVHLDLLKDMIERGFITDADAQPLRDAILGFAVPGGALGTARGPVSPGSSQPPLGLPSGLGTTPASGSATGSSRSGSGSSGDPDTSAQPQPQPTPPDKADQDDPAAPAPRQTAQSGHVKTWKPLHGKQA